MLHSLVTACYSCGAQITFGVEAEIALCPFCGKYNDRPRVREESIVQAMKRANELCDKGEFTQAEKTYQLVLSRNPDEHEARWGLLRCRYGIEYETDPRSGRRIPTCRLTRSLPMRLDPEFKSACALASPDVRAQYERECHYIDAIQERIRKIAEGERVWDVFICFKETEPDGSYTPERKDGYELYRALERAGYRAFFSPESIRGALGEDYEAAIYSAVHTSQVMLLLTRSEEHISSTWVRSEWTRFLDSADAGARKKLIPVYAGITPEAFPMEIRERRLQGVCLDRPFAIDEILSAVSRFVRRASDYAEKEALALCRSDAPAAERSIFIRTYCLAREGDAKAQLVVGSTFFEGRIVSRNLDRAEEWYRLASRNGSDEAFDALNRVALERAKPTPEALYRRGQDAYSSGHLESAAADYAEAARQGYSPACGALGKCYFSGSGVKRDAAAAVHWLSQAPGNDFESAYLLGLCYERGQGAFADPIHAVELYRSAMNGGWQAAQIALARCLLSGVGGAKNPAEAVRLLQEVRAIGDAALLLSDCYERGDGVARNKREAERLLKYAETHGCAEEIAERRRVSQQNILDHRPQSGLSKLTNLLVKAFWPGNESAKARRAREEDSQPVAKTSAKDPTARSVNDSISEVFTSSPEDETTDGEIAREDVQQKSPAQATGKSERPQSPVPQETPSPVRDQSPVPQESPSPAQAQSAVLQEAPAPIPAAPDSPADAQADAGMNASSAAIHDSKSALKPSAGPEPPSPADAPPENLRADKSTSRPEDDSDNELNDSRLAEKFFPENFSLALEAFRLTDPKLRVAKRISFADTYVSAAQGRASAQFKLGALFRDGKYVSPNADQARRWFHLAAKQNHDGAQAALAALPAPEAAVDSLEASQADGDSDKTEDDSQLAEKFFPENVALALVAFHRADPELSVVERISFADTYIAAAQGKAAAQFKLGALYRDGKYVSPNVDQARRWFQLAAKQNHEGAQTALSALDNEPAPKPEVPRSEREEAEALMNPTASIEERRAFCEIYHAAQAGDTVAQRRISAFYSIGKYVPRNSGEATRWMRRALHVDQNTLDVRLRTEADRLVKPNASDETRFNFSSTYVFAVRDHSPEACYQLSEAYERGDVIEANPERAREWLRAAAERGHVIARARLGMEEHTSHEAADFDSIYASAVQDNDPEAQYTLSQLYASGSGVKRNAAKALEWLETAAQNGNAKAQYDLGARLYLGQNGSPQPVKGRFWLKKAAAQKYAPAREFLKTHS